MTDFRVLGWINVMTNCVCNIAKKRRDGALYTLQRSHCAGYRCVHCQISDYNLSTVYGELRM